jgi:hypothetical protein
VEFLRKNPMMEKKILTNPLLKDKAMQKIVSEVASKLITTLTKPEDVIIE